MFERFTERARQVVVLAQEEARGLRHNYIGTEHILLGLLRAEDGLAARVLERLDVTLERVRTRLVGIVGPGQEVTSGQIPFTPRAKKVLERALRESLSLGHNYIGTEHILLGLVREDEGVAMRILLELDTDPEKIRQEVLSLLSQHSGGHGSERTARAALLDPEAAAPGEADWQPGLQWDQASVHWNPDGPELRVPLRLEQRACALLAQSSLWQQEALAGVHHDVGHGRITLRSSTLLEAIDPRELRSLLDDALEQAHQQSLQARSREARIGEAFLAALREPPAAE